MTSDDEMFTFRGPAQAPRDALLSEFRQGAGGIDPVIDQQADYARGVKAVQKVVHAQGQVMSAALSNNEKLYYTNKALTQRCRELDSENAHLRTENRNLRTQLAELQRSHDEAGDDRWKQLYLRAKLTLEAYLHESVPEDKLAERLKAMNEQAKEIDAMPLRATAEDFEDLTEPGV